MSTVIEHVLSRLRDIGLTDVFGVPGDFSFAVNDGVSAYPGLRWIGCCNELDAGYAADGYARLLHRSLGDGEFDWFRRMSESVVCASAVMTPQNALWETERLIYEAF